MSVTQKANSATVARRRTGEVGRVCEFPGCGRRVTQLKSDGAVRTRQLPPAYGCESHGIEDIALEKLHEAASDLIAWTAGLGGRVRASRNRLAKVLDELEVAF